MIERHGQTANRASDITQFLAAASNFFVFPSLIILQVNRGFQGDKILKRFAASGGNGWGIALSQVPGGHSQQCNDDQERDTPFQELNTRSRFGELAPSHSVGITILRHHYSQIPFDSRVNLVLGQ